MSRRSFLQLFKSRLGSKLQAKMDRRYNNTIRKVLYKHRLIQHRRNTLRVDYVGLEAFGVQSTAMEKQLDLERREMKSFDKQLQNGTLEG